MTTKFKNTYRVESARLKGWDYRSQGAYFITICTHHKTCYFGDIIDGQMHYSPLGVVADVLLYETQHRNDNIELGEYIVMPNHIHVIININKSNTEVTPITPTKQTGNRKMAARSPKAGSISSVIRSYKGAVTKHANRLGYEFAWQTRFHDHVIRDQAAFEKITEYVINNPLSWELDKFYQPK